MSDATDDPTPGTPPPLAFIYDRRTSDTDASEGILRRRLTACRQYAAAQGWEQAGEWIDHGDAALSMTVRPQLEAMLGLIRHYSASRIVVCLVADWTRLANDPAPLARYCYKVEQAGGQVVTAAGAAMGQRGGLTTPVTWRP
jgi:DNA invertase Pin-like site-specific DNA recombinase